MLSGLLELTILFFVIFDPLMSFAVFFTATEKMSRELKNKTAFLAILVAFSLSFSVLLLGENFLKFFSTNIKDLKVAGGIILSILGIKMALGQPIETTKEIDDKSARAIATIIGTPLLTGPAAITTILISVNDYGKLTTAIAITIVLLLTALLFYLAAILNKLIGKTAIQIISTILGIISLTWGVMFIRSGLGF